ncbi:hypothetical protein B0I35DRAFT_478566 [Stachybotrys elegans]|uniref:Uncharacterized protein n=1 Tax=Stachybotrys elegans TaxID=80388 RepID=A0A8K0STE0_9HYPO|nr:hypothetical protein B0I35DRAFT_478566 [Stachybotrys elegans]
MASFGRQYTNSPVLTMSPQPFLQTPLPMGGFPCRRASPRAFGASPPMPIMAAALPRAAGRKRSRDEASVNLESDAPVLQPVSTEQEWTYGEGMVLIKPENKYVADAGSQSGTWLEDKNAQEKKSRQQQLDAHVRPRSFKSQRMGFADDHANTTVQPAAFATLSTGSSPVENANGPIIDDFTLHLGIGWRRISADEHIQAASRGWARYIENHYPLSNVRICLESKGLLSYLVEANEGFFLFAENLRQGRLISHTVQSTLANLQQSPPAFEGADTLFAAESPRPLETAPVATTVDSEMSLC